MKLRRKVPRPGKTANKRTDPNRATLCALIDRVGTGIGEIAKLLDVSPRTLYGWRHGNTPVPRIAVLAMRALLSELPGSPDSPRIELLVVDRIVCRKVPASAAESGATVLEYVSTEPAATSGSP